MTDIRFYHLQKQTLDQALPLILEKAGQSGKNITVRLSNKNEVERMNAHLWGYKPESFMAHGCKKDGRAEKQPIWLSDLAENPNQAKILILTQGQEVALDEMATYDLCCEMLDGRDDEAVSKARARWKLYKEADHDITYWHQSENGRWEKKA